MSSKIFYCTKVVAYGILCIITKLEFFQHHFSKMGHGNTSCDPHLHLSHQATNAALPHAQRPPPGGYVLTLVLTGLANFRLVIPKRQSWKLGRIATHSHVLCVIAKTNWILTS